MRSSLSPTDCILSMLRREEFFLIAFDVKSIAVAVSERLRSKADPLNLNGYPVVGLVSCFFYFQSFLILFSLFYRLDGCCLLGLLLWLLDCLTL